MSHFPKKGSVRPTVPSPDGVPAEDPHTAIEREFLGLWLGMARLREQIRRALEQSCRIIAKPPKPAAGRKPRRRAA